MQAWWLRFQGFKPGCVEAPNAEEAKRIGKEITGCEVTSCDILPYPANPRLNGKDGWNADAGECPSFCHSPEQCKGRTACPQHYSCTE